jgi:BMFP domain-containing protein YqiC
VRLPFVRRRRLAALEARIVELEGALARAGRMLAHVELVRRRVAEGRMRARVAWAEIGAATKLLQREERKP